MKPSLSLLRVAACIGQLRQVVGPDRVEVCDRAIAGLADGDVRPSIELLSRAAIGTRDGPLREAILEGWALLDEVEQEFAACFEPASVG